MTECEHVCANRMRLLQGQGRCFLNSCNILCLTCKQHTGYIEWKCMYWSLFPPPKYFMLCENNSHFILLLCLSKWGLVGENRDCSCLPSHQLSLTSTCVPSAFNLTATKTNLPQRQQNSVDIIILCKESLELAIKSPCLLLSRQRVSFI